jgi:Flp pilus assembly protein TadD
MVPQMPLLRAPLRTPRMVAAIQQAEEHNQRGIVLANRGASYSARAEFISALKAISQALDTETGSAEYSRAMAAGMRALEESEDFVPRGSRLSGEIDMAMIVRSHRTPIKREVEAAGMSPSIAAQQYQRYAADRLGVSVGGEVAGSLALHSVGKLFGQFAHDPSNSTIDAQGKAIAFQRAALVADPNNYLAANELAVLVAHQGNFAEARDLLLRAISLKPQPSMWHNLSVIHAKLGETELADLAQRTAMSAAGGANPGNVEAMAALQAVRWVDPATFSQMSPPPADLNPAPSGSNPPEAAAKAPPAGNQKGISRWAPWGTRQQ